MPHKHRNKIILSVSLILLLSLFLGSLNSIVTLWKSVYTQEGQSINAYNSVELDIFNAIERSAKSVFPPSQTSVEKVYLYISEKNQNYLLSSLPYSKNKWVQGLILDDNKLKKISVKHRGDNPNNWLHGKKSWRVKRKKKDLQDGIRVFNYSLPRDTSLVNTYMGYYIARKMNIPVPDFKFVELYINDIYEGIYLETQHIDENFLRKNNIMPVNIYKGTPSRTDKPLNLDNDLFNNPNLWEKRSIFNPRKEGDYFDLDLLMSLTLSSVNNSEEMLKLEKIADISKWANFSAYETIMQSWHNYEKNNMYLISDPWTGEVYPIAYDTILNDTKSLLVVDEPVLMDNGAHALMELYSNNSRFLLEKYKIINTLLKNGFYEDIQNEIDRVYQLIRSSWRDDPSHSQFVLTNEFDRSLFFNNNMDDEVEKLKSRVDFIKEEIQSRIKNNTNSTWSQYKNKLDIVVDSYNPISKLRLCPSNNSERDLKIIENDNSFDGFLDGEGCFIYDIVLNSNRIKSEQNRSRITTFFAGRGYGIHPTLYKFILDKDLQIDSIYVKHVGDIKFTDLKLNKTSPRNSRGLHNNPFSSEPVEKEIVWEGNININKLTIVEDPIRILPGTVIQLGPKGSIIFKNKVLSLGTNQDKVEFIPSQTRPWKIIALFGKKTKGSRIEHTVMSGGSGGQIGGYYFTGMFSIYSSEDVVLSNLEISNNAEYDDLIHILYSHNIELRDSYIFDARADAIDIDISEMTIDNCQFFNSGNDAVDSMSSRVHLQNTLINKAGDKGLSAGENSEVYVKNLTFEQNNIAIQSKDGTKVFVSSSTFLNNNSQLDAYLKNWRYGAGGKIRVNGSSFKADKNIINAKNNSEIFVAESTFNKSFDHLESKKVKFSNNLIEND